MSDTLNVGFTAGGLRLQASRGLFSLESVGNILSTTGSTGPPPPPPGANVVGVNMAAAGDANMSEESFPLFKNRFRESAYSAAVAVNSSGWPTVGFSCQLWQGNITPSWLTAGYFNCGFSGSGAETVAQWGSGTISNLARVGGVTTFRYTTTGGNSGFTVGNVTQAVTNIYAYLPEYNTLSGIDNPMSISAFTTEAISLYSQFAWIRWMHWSNSLFNTGQNTSTTRYTSSNFQNQRGATTNPTANQVNEGYPSDWAASFCAACDIGLWYTLPVWDDGTNGGPGSYCTSLFQMLNTVLVPNGKPIYIEIGNELVWNGAYACTQRLETNAVAAGFPNTAAGYFQYLGYMLHEAAVIARNVFGAKFGTQVFLVLATQQGGSGIAVYATNALNYISQTYYGGGSVVADVQYGATAPYINLSNNAGDTTQALVLSDLQTQANQEVWANLNEHMTVTCMHFGLKGLVSYEGGWQVNSEPSGNANIVPVLTTGSSLTPVIESHWTNVLQAGFVGFTHFCSGVSNGAGLGNGYYPGNEFSANYAAFVAGIGPPSTSSPTLAALQSFITAPTPMRNLVAGTTTINGNNFADLVNGVAYGSGAFPANFETSFANLPIAYGCAVLLNCTAPGTYSPVINMSASATTNVEVNGTVVQTAVSLVSGNNTLQNITLVAGPNYILFGNGSYYVATINSITLTAIAVHAELTDQGGTLLTDQGTTVLTG